MKTISIGTQSSTAELVTAFAEALAEEIGWTADEDGNVKKDGISVYFKFIVSSNSVRITVSNGYKDSDSSATCTFSATNTYKLNVLETAGGSIAVGISAATDTPNLGALIVRSTVETYVGIAFNSSYIYALRGIESSTRPIKLSLNTDSGVSTSIVRMPDIWGAAMFIDLYYVVSCPFQSTDRVFSIGGKNYRSVGTSNSYMYFALPEE